MVKKKSQSLLGTGRAKSLPFDKTLPCRSSSEKWWNKEQNLNLTTRGLTHWAVFTASRVRDLEKRLSQRRKKKKKAPLTFEGKRGLTTIKTPILNSSYGIQIKTFKVSRLSLQWEHQNSSSLPLRSQDYTFCSRCSLGHYQGLCIFNRSVRTGSKKTLPPTFAEPRELRCVHTAQHSRSITRIASTPWEGASNVENLDQLDKVKVQMISKRKATDDTEASADRDTGTLYYL